MADTGKLGISGRLAARFQDNPLTPILAILGLLLGLVAVLVTPQEEEPQIDVTMANVFVPFPGADARQVEQLVSFPLEKKLSEIEGVKHVYSISRPGMAVLTVEYTVGVERQPAIVRLYNQVYSNQDWMPPGVGVGQPLVKPKGIDDVPVMALTLWSDDPAVDGQALAQVAHSLETELKRVPGTRDVYTLGAYNQAVTVELDPALRAATPPGAVLFVFAKRVDGGGPPVAAKRLPVSAFPVQLALSDADSIMPTATLSSQAAFTLSARISASGSAEAGAGDWQSETLTVQSDKLAPVTLVLRKQP